jgi:aryl-alcohol dehydrogenase-like predicted oxidoreductase
MREMQHRTFGRLTGLRVSDYALGTGCFGTRRRSGAEPAEARRMFERFAEAGGTLLDTADSYQQGESESLVGEFIASERDHFVVATKFSGGDPLAPHVQTTGASRRTMIRSVETSLERLNTDRLDILWVHFDDQLTPAEEILRGLDDLVTAGKVLYGALSNFPAWRVSRAQTIAELRGMAPIVGIQVEYSLVERTADRDLLPMAEALGLGIAVWSPLGGGLLTGKYRGGDEGRLTDWKVLVHTEDTTQKAAVVDELVAISDELEVPPAHVAMAWLRSVDSRSATSVVPVIGPRSSAQLEDYLAALAVDLPPEHVARLDEVSRPSLGVPHEMVRSVRGMVRGGGAERVADPHTPVA